MWPRRCSRPPACCSRWRRGRSRTSPTSRGTSGPRSSRRCRPTISSTRCSRRPASRMPEHARRIRFRRKALRQPDEFHTLTSQAMAWLGAHRELAAGIALALLVAAAAVLAVSQYRASQVGRAAESFRSAQATFEAGRFADAAAAFEMLGETFPRTPSGRLAGLYRAHALARQGDGSAAAAAYSEYLASGPAADYLRQEAL